MIESPGLLLTLLAFALVIGPLVFVHEMGHYLAGRMFGVKAEAFSIGFGREIAGWTDKRGTRWKLGWLPLGGYVRFAGDMNPASQPDAAWLALPAEERNRTFQAKRLWQRAIIVAAGPVVNFVLAIFILAGFAMAYGEDRTPATVGAVVPGSAAQAIGLQAGDRIVSLGGERMDTFGDMLVFVNPRAGERVEVVAERSGATFTRTATLKRQVMRDRFGNTESSGLLGISPGPSKLVPVAPWRAPVVAARQVGDIVSLTISKLRQLVIGQAPVKELHGPVGMARISGQFLSLGVPALVYLVALVSINLGFINLLPVPMLDGGHLFFYAIEAVRRRPVEPRVQEWAFRGGLAAILALMLVVTFNDLGSAGLWKSLAGLIG
ncbi:RIP metalloprotease RseP [Sphingomonas aerophila]|uniref:Zinc metalloprotease n=1 Tax=Sphingomonas aerophila TaxID=1344948 RepID=A0A7W9EU18_9SPHN|nr:regulator of sigma E protease [Sphingomonas aerophila]